MGTAIVLLILVCVVSAILHHLIKRKKSGQGICSCGTGSCGGLMRYDDNKNVTRRVGHGRAD